MAPRALFYAVALDLLVVFVYGAVAEVLCIGLGLGSERLCYNGVLDLVKVDALVEQINGTGA